VASVAVFFSCILGGCHAPGLDPVSTDRQVIGEVMMHSELAVNLRALAMPDGRLSGAPNGHKAEQYVADKLREYGLSNVHFEPFEMLTWQDNETVVTVLDDPSQVLENTCSLAHCKTTPAEGVTAELVAVGEGTPEDFEATGDNLRGRFALVREGAPKRRDVLLKACELGVAGVVYVSHQEDVTHVGMGHLEPSPQPAVVITGADGAQLAQRLEAGQTVRLNIKIEAESWQATPNNVVGEIPGQGGLADEVIILGAHLDSWHLAEGALDNGTGSTAILEAARALAAIDWRPQRTVRFVWFMGEEHGLFGSKAYVNAHEDELDHIVVVVNVDMPGSPRSLYTLEHAELNPLLELLVADLKGFEMSEEIGSGSWTGSDHAPFMKQGVCAMSLSGDLGPGVKYYHSSGDKYEEVDRRGTNQAAAMLAVLIRRLADAPERPGQRYDPVKLAEEKGWELD
jgi:Iap family predicted aminopeptidase